MRLSQYWSEDLLELMAIIEGALGATYDSHAQVVDKFNVVTNRELTRAGKGLLEMAGIEPEPLSYDKPVQSKKKADVKKRDILYRRFYGLGSLNILLDPIYTHLPKHKVDINPSALGLSLPGVERLIHLLFGTLDDIYVKRLDHKIDVYSNDIQELFDAVYVKGLHKANVKDLKRGTLRIGRRGYRQVIIYDITSRHPELICNVRIEHSRTYRNKSEKSLKEFLDEAPSLNPFEEIYFIDPNAKHLKGIIQPSDKTPVVFNALRRLTADQRSRLLQRLESAGELKTKAQFFKQDYYHWRRGTDSTIALRELMDVLFARWQTHPARDSVAPKWETPTVDQLRESMAKWRKSP